MHCRAPLCRPGADRCREASVGHQGQHGDAGAQPGEAGPGLQPGHQVMQGPEPGGCLMGQSRADKATRLPEGPGPQSSASPGPWEGRADGLQLCPSLMAAVHLSPLA